jgi:hypothetical protein
MTLTSRPRPIRVAVATCVIAALIAAGAVGLAALTRSITGTANPLPRSWPWQWSWTAIVNWFSSDTTSAEAGDVAVRIIVVVSWILFIALATNLIGELSFQARHGVTISPVVDDGGVDRRTIRSVPSTRPGRVHRRHTFAATFVSLLLGSSTLIAHPAPAIARTVPVSVVSVTDSHITDATPATPAVIDETRWVEYRVQSPHESLASIARDVAGDPSLARAIWEASRDRDMGNGERFTDPAQLRVGWVLLIPTHEPPAHAPATSPSHVITIQDGDTLWDHVDAVVPGPPTPADIEAVARHADGATTPEGPWVFDAANPGLVHRGMQIDLQPAIDLHSPPADTPTVEPAAPAAPAAPVVEDLAGVGPAASPTAPAAPVTQPPAPPVTPPTGPTSVPTARPSPAAAPATTAAPPAPAPAPVATHAVPPVPLPATRTPTSNTVQPGDRAATPPANVTVDDPAADTSTVPVLPIAMAGMSLAGLVMAIDRRRRRRQSHHPAGQQIALPDGETDLAERAIRAGAHLDRVARLNASLRHLAGELADRNIPLRSRHIIVDNTTVTIHFDTPQQPPAGWIAAEELCAWRCTLDDTALQYAADINPQPWPAVVPIGVTDTGDDVLVDLEALGCLALDGPAASEALGAIVCALGASPTTELLTVIDDGNIALHNLAPILRNRLGVADLDHILDRLDAWYQPFETSADHVLALRYRNAGDLEPCIAAIVTDLTDTQRDRISGLCLDGTRPVAIVTTNTDIAHHTLHIDTDGTTHFNGMTVRCHRITPGIAAAVTALADHAATAPSEPINHTPATTTPDATTAATSGPSDTNRATDTPVLDGLDAPSPLTATPLSGNTESAWTVRLLGPLRIVHPDHGDLARTRSSRQLCTLLALHPTGLEGPDLHDLVHPDLVRDLDAKRAWAKTGVSELRKALGGGDTIAGRNHLPITSTAGNTPYRLRLVDVDVSRFRQLIRIDELDHLDAITALTDAMQLVAGDVRAGDLCHWAWSAGIIHELEALIVHTGRALAERALAAGQPALADWSATQTRLGVPYDQAVVPLLVAARTQLGDRSGIRRLREELIDTHDGDLAVDVQAAFARALATG